MIDKAKGGGGLTGRMMARMILKMSEQAKWYQRRFRGRGRVAGGIETRWRWQTI